MLGLSRFFGIVAILLLVLGANTYHERRWLGQRYLVGFLPLLIWFTLPPELLIANALLYLFGVLGMHIFVFEDMTYELRVANRRLRTAQDGLREPVITDAMTGCHNRRFFDEVISRELQRHERYSIPMLFLFVDVDRFKNVNDTLGHEAGDRLLQYVALFLCLSVREADYGPGGAGASSCSCCRAT